MKKIFYIALLLISHNGFGQFEVHYSDLLQGAYEEILKLNFEKASALIDQSKVEEPNNLAYLHLENYIDFFHLFIYEDIVYFNRVKRKKEERLNLLEELSDTDPFKNFIKAEINLHWALTRSKFNELFKAGREIYTAYRLLEENTKSFPNFIYNYKSLSIIHSLVETISVPGVFKNIFGMSGSIEQGLAEILKVNDYADRSPFMFELEAEAIYVFMALYQDNNQSLAFEFLEKSKLNKDNSPLAAFVKVKLLQRTGKNDQAIELLLETLSFTSARKFPYLYFLMGVSHLRKLDIESISYLHEFLDHFNGLHYIKEAHQKLAWANLIFYQDLAAYDSHMLACVAKGNALIDDDKQALREAKKNLTPNATLLKARILFDGGYYQKAYQMLITNSELLFQNNALKLEYYYRLGRVTQALKNYPEAIQYYFLTIGVDPEQTSYMSCNAVLNLGIIYESQDEIDQARKYFHQCLSMEPSEYEQSLHQKARSGLNRLQKK